RRQAEAARIMEKCPDRIPVRFFHVSYVPVHVPFINKSNWLWNVAAMMSAIYEENKDEDGFLYATYSGENTFGSV
ncbi:unnamed protein product, partial [Ilex paraguariensis]